jgi:dolichol-phosphate mannosyltransferase
MLIIALLAYGALFHYLAIGLPGVPYRQDKVQPVAWRQLGEDVRAIEAEVEARTGEKPLVVGMDKYNLASELAFYRRQQGESTKSAVANTASRNLFGGGALMYELWSPAGDYSGRTMILVSFRPKALSDEALADFSADMGPIQERSVAKLGVPAGRYYYRVVDDYQGDRAAPTSPLR